MEVNARYTCLTKAGGVLSKMGDLDDFFGDDLSPRDEPPKRGGRREGAGRKPKGVGAKEYTDYASARARKEVALADKAEMEAEVMAGTLVSREAVRNATATAFAAIAQTLQSIPDRLERQDGISLEVAAKVQAAIDAATDDLSAELERMCNDVK